MIILNILCEGQSEQQFVAKVLRPYLLPHNIVAKPTLLITNRRLDARGGMIDYNQVKRDLGNLIKTSRDTEYEKHFFTTMFDLYALPEDFPGAAIRQLNCYAKVDNIEKAFGQDVNFYRFIPYIELHEFETLVLCNIKRVITEYPLSKVQLEELDSTWRKECDDNAELVNTSYDTAPSKRLIKAVGKHYHYNKTRMASVVTSDKGVDALRIGCRHFNQWIETILNLEE